MRTRLIVPAVLIATAAYMKGRRDGRLAGRYTPPDHADPASPLADQDGIARALAADAVELADAQTAAAGAPVLAPARPRPADDADDEREDPFAVSEAVLASEWVTAPAAAATATAPAPAEVEVRVDETGRFSLGGYATQAGHIALAGITFRERRSGLVTPDALALVTEAASNVADGGLVVLSDPGFAPDEEGFTLLLAAEGPGTFAAAGYYELGPR